MIAAFFGRIWARVALVGGLALALVAAVGWLFMSGKRAGRNEIEHKVMKEEQDAQRRMENARRDVARDARGTAGRLRDGDF